jgi:hypothetical protein
MFESFVSRAFVAVLFPVASASGASFLAHAAAASAPLAA